MASRSGVLPVLLLVAACTPRQGPHQTLVAPSASAATAERLAAHERLFARADAVSGVYGGTLRTDYLVLGDGTRVYHAEDLIPVVDAASPTARAAARSAAASEAARRQQSKAEIAWYVIGAGVLLGTALMAAGSASDDGAALMFSGCGLASGSMLGGLVASEVFTNDKQERDKEVSEERVSAFATYNSDLVKRLGLCADGNDVSPCPAPADTAAPTATSNPGDGSSAASTAAAP